jgi:hypothetical protein
MNRFALVIPILKKDGTRDKRYTANAALLIGRYDSRQEAEHWKSIYDKEHKSGSGIARCR